MFDQQLTMDGGAEDLAPRHEQPKLFAAPRTMRGQLAMPAQTCDICGDVIEPGEHWSDDGSEVAHTACVDDWFRRNFGRESLR